MHFYWKFLVKQFTIDISFQCYVWWLREIFYRKFIIACKMSCHSNVVETMIGNYLKLLLYLAHCLPVPMKWKCLGPNCFHNAQQSLYPFMHDDERLVKHTSKILRSSRRNISKVSMTIFRHHAWLHIICRGIEKVGEKQFSPSFLILNIIHGSLEQIGWIKNFRVERKSVPVLFLYQKESSF